MVDYVGGNLDQGTPIDHIRVPHEGPVVNGARSGWGLSALGVRGRAEVRGGADLDVDPALSPPSLRAT